MYKLTINGIEYDTATNWSISEKSGNPISSTFSVEVPPGKRIPKAQDLVEFFVDETPLFRGLCKIPKGVAFSTGNEVRKYTLTCNNYNSVLSNRLPNISYENKTLTYVVTDLFNEYISKEGFTLGRIEVVDEPVFDIYNSKEIALNKLLNELAEYVDAVWEITDDKVFNFYSAKLHPSGRVYLRADNAGLGALSHTCSDNNLRTRQIIEGATMETTTQTETFTFVPNEKGVAFLVVYPVAQKPSIAVNGVPVSPDIIGIRGIDDSDNTKLFMFQNNNTSISVNSNYAGTPLVEGDSISISYIGIIDIRIEVDNAGKIAEIAGNTGLSGIIENYHNDNTLQTALDAYSKASALLLEHGEEKNTLTAKCTTEVLQEVGLNYENTAVGTLWVFDLPDLNISGEYVITERKITANVLDTDGSYELSLKWADRDLSGCYAKTLSDLEDGQRRLQVRKDLKIIKYQRFEEKTTLAEDLTTTALIPQFCGEGIYNGQVAIPCGTLYPWVCF